MTSIFRWENYGSEDEGEERRDTGTADRPQTPNPSPWSFGPVLILPFPLLLTVLPCASTRTNCPCPRGGLGHHLLLELAELGREAVNADAGLLQLLVGSPH
jgi:hypothetical protein